MKSNKLIKLLPYDTNLFGYNVFTTTDCKITAILNEAKSLNGKLIYIFPKNASDKLEIEEMGISEIDTKINYLILTDSFSLLTPKTNVSFQISSYSKQENFDELLELSYVSGEYSRFNLDPKFKKKEFKKLYRDWTIKSVNKEIADDVIIVKRDTELVGFVTYLIKKNTLEIGLIAVKPNKQKQGIGNMLISQIYSIAKTKNINVITVATQKQNLNACRFYEKFGFYPHSEQSIYHLWL